jgi:CMP-N,N'-diacetyllegionaminic acid synthase
MKPLVIIPARGGSKGIPGKNIKLLGGKPLIHYTIEAARALFDDEIICVSTDDIEIKQVAEQAGIKVPFLRPDNLATDTSSTHDVLLHAVEYYESKNYIPDTVILLQPTSPFRKIEHIKGALNLFDQSLDMIVSVKETRANPYYILFEENEGGFLKKSKEGSFTRRQDCPKVWEYNGAIYIINVDSLKKNAINKFINTKKYVMDEVSSHDIDLPIDWEMAELMLSKITGV